MDAFIRYMTRKKPAQYFFIKNIAIIRFSTCTDILDLKTGELLDSLKIRHLSQVLYCDRRNTLFLKSVTGPVYAYQLESKELKRICSTGNSHYGMFLSRDQRSLVVFSGIGKCWTIDTDTWDKRDLYQSEQSCVYSCGWDDPAEQCFIFFSCSVDDTMLLTKVGYDRTVLAQAIYKSGLQDVTLHCIEHFPQNDLFILQFSACDLSDEDNYLKLLEPLENVQSLEELDDAFLKVVEMHNADPPDVSVVCSTDSLANGKSVFNDAYKAGNPCSCIFESCLFITVGNDRIHLIDLQSYQVIKEFSANTAVFHIQYDPFRNVLFVTDFGFTVIHDAIDGK